MSNFSINAAPQYPFASGQNGYVIAASTTTATVAVTTTGADSVVVANTTTGWAWITFAATSAFPTAGTPAPGFPVPPGGVATYSLPAGTDGRSPAKLTNVSAILSTGTGNVYVSLGSGA
jgi:hypothetical protein